MSTLMKSLSLGALALLHEESAFRQSVETVCNTWNFYTQILSVKMDATSVGLSHQSPSEGFSL